MGPHRGAQARAAQSIAAETDHPVTMEIPWKSDFGPLKKEWVVAIDAVAKCTCWQGATPCATCAAYQRYRAGAD